MERFITREQKPNTGSHENMIHIPRTPQFNSNMPREYKPQLGMIANQVAGYQTMSAPEHTNMAVYQRQLDHTNMAAYHRMPEQTNMLEYSEHYCMPMHDMGRYGNEATVANAYGGGQGGQSTIEYYEENYITPANANPQMMLLDRPEYSDRQPSYSNLHPSNMYEPQHVRNPPSRQSATVTSWIEPLSIDFVSELQMLSEGKPTLVESQKSFKDIKREIDVSSVADVWTSKSIPSSKAGWSKAKERSVEVVQESVNDKNKTEIDVGLTVFTGNVTKVLKWYEVVQNLGVSCLFEVIGKCVIVGSSKQLQKHFLLRDQTGPVLQVVFHEIDFLMHQQANGSMIRVVGRMVGRNRMQSFCVRAARGREVEDLPRVTALAQHHIAKLTTTNKSTTNK